MDATKPLDKEEVSKFAGYIREVRAAVLNLGTVLGIPLYSPVEVTAPTHSIGQLETFIKANAGVTPQIFIADPEVLIPGIIYMIKKVDDSNNTITLIPIAGSYINDTETSVQAVLKQEVISFVNTGIGIQTC